MPNAPQSEQQNAIDGGLSFFEARKQGFVERLNQKNGISVEKINAWIEKHGYWDDNFNQFSEKVDQQSFRNALYERD